jgi:hypothetical protein
MQHYVIKFGNDLPGISLYLIRGNFFTNVLLLKENGDLIRLGIWYCTHLQQFFSYIVFINFTGGGNP